MVGTVLCDDYGLEEGIYPEDEIQVGVGTYTQCGEEVVTTYSVTEGYLWTSAGGCPICDSLAGVHENNPGASGSAHSNCRCTSQKVFVVAVEGEDEGAMCALCGGFFYIEDMQGSYCLDCVEIIKQALEDAAEGCFWTGVVLTAGGIIVAVIPGYQLVGAGIALLGLSAFAVDRYASEAAKDPPDESYKEEVELREIGVEPPGQPDSAVYRAVTSFLHSCALLDALRISMERFSFAASVHDRKYIALQGKSVAGYRDGLLTALDEQIAALEELRGEITGTEADVTVGSEHIRELQERLETGGFSSEELDSLEELGMDLNEIAELRQRISGAEPSQFTGMLGDVLRNSAANLETLKSNMKPQ